MIAVVVLLVAGVATYLLLDARSSRAAERDLAASYLKAWSSKDYSTMHRELGDDVAGRLDEARFTEIMRGALTTATATSLTTGELRRTDGGFSAPVSVRTRLFGTLRGTVAIPLDGSGDQAGIRWSRRMAFPGLRAGETVSRTTEMPARADILARDGSTVLAGGTDRTSDVPNIAGQVVGALGTATDADKASLRALGVPDGAKVGVSGLERILNPQLVGTPGGTLKAGDRVLAEVAPKKARAVRSSISIAVVKAAAAAQANAPDASGTMVIDSRTGEVLGFQGSAWTALQPPGSTMKIVTAAAALEDGVAKTTTTYPRQTEAEGFGIQNADGESCGGTLVESFAHSCNSVFVPMGAKLGSKRLVEMAEKFGFNEKTPGIPGAEISTIAKASTMDDRQAAVSAIGQGTVQATSLQIALMTATIANGGRQPELTFLRTSRTAKTKRVISAKTASGMRQLMAAVIADGTGESARVALPGITTAGKTGTAELATTQGAQCDAEAAARAEQQVPDKVTEAPEPVSACGNVDGKSTTAWMSAFAPITRRGDVDPVAIGVLRARNFQGGGTAAPVARQVLTAALGG
ncbi:penicillin-binding transpeptidase domain-containing protein [Patulibacter sp.]|uniref:penicillin-binding transpeptidase domain-containing protein n=1 Tax=Patulibacter sp. TaxID=1912859 RepID=UPI0027187074|nr:penicillin-binding transpeptidase domain-containing protein [Patulibacter sp.]MDO9408692.1 penicillin-binding transpeptidase domain-containing protein [Patulibacter sp.]